MNKNLDRCNEKGLTVFELDGRKLRREPIEKRKALAVSQHRDFL